MPSNSEFILALVSYNTLKGNLLRARSMGEVTRILSENEKQYRISKKIYNIMTRNEIRRLIFNCLNLTMPTVIPSPSLVSYYCGIFTLRPTSPILFRQKIYPFYKYCAVRIRHKLHIYLNNELYKIIKKVINCASLDDYLSILYEDGSFAVYFRGPDTENIIFNGHIASYGHKNPLIFNLIMGFTFLGPAIAIPSWENTVIIIFQNGKEPKEFIFDKSRGSIGSHYFYHFSRTVLGYGTDTPYTVEDYNKFRQGSNGLPVPIEEIINECPDMSFNTSVRGVRKDADIFTIYITDDDNISINFKEDVLFDTKEMRIIARFHYPIETVMSFFLASKKEIVDSYTGDLLLKMPDDTVINYITRKLDDTGFDVWIHGMNI